MKTTVTHKEKELVAIIAEGNQGIFFRSGAGNVFIDATGEAYIDPDHILEQLLSDGLDRTPVYEGDKVTLEF